MGATAGAAQVERLSDLSRLADAEREARAALAAEPQSPALLAALSRVFLQGRDYAAGLAAADAAAAQAPDDERLHRLRALHLSGLGFHRDAAAAAHAAVVLAPQEPLTAITQARVVKGGRGGGPRRSARAQRRAHHRARLLAATGRRARASGVFAAGVWLVLVALGLLAAVVRLVRGLRRRT